MNEEQNNYVSISISDIKNDRREYTYQMISYNPSGYECANTGSALTRVELYSNLIDRLKYIYKGYKIIVDSTQLGFIKYVIEFGDKSMLVEKPKHPFVRMINYGVALTQSVYDYAMNNIDYSRIRDINPLLEDLVVSIKDKSTHNSPWIKAYALMEDVLRRDRKEGKFDPIIDLGYCPSLKKFEEKASKAKEEQKVNNHNSIDSINGGESKTWMDKMEWDFLKNWHINPYKDIKMNTDAFCKDTDEKVYSIEETKAMWRKSQCSEQKLNYCPLSTHELMSKFDEYKIGTIIKSIAVGNHIFEIVSDDFIMTGGLRIAKAIDVETREEDYVTVFNPYINKFAEILN